MKKILLLLSAVFWAGVLSGDLPVVEDYLEFYGQGYLRSNFGYSEAILDKQEEVTTKALMQLEKRRDGELCDYGVYLSFQVSALEMFEKSNTAGKFPIISRLPPEHTSGKSANELVLNDLVVGLTGVLPWVTGYVEGQYTEIKYHGQRDFQLRQYWVTLGDLREFPVYMTFGRKTVPFGDFSSYSPFTHAYVTHYFWAQSVDPILSLGYMDYGYNVELSWIANGRGRRVLNTPKDSGWDNFAVKVSKEHEFCEGVNGRVGAGYLYGTIYDSRVAHHPPSDGAGDNEFSPLWVVNGSFTYNQFDVSAEFGRTVKRWPAVDHKVHAWTLQGRYRDEIECMPVVYSVMFNRGVQGSSGSEWDRMHQLVVGFEIKPHENLRLGLEYVYNLGFVPLIRPQQSGDRDVESHTLILGGEFIF